MCGNLEIKNESRKTVIYNEKYENKKGVFHLAIYDGFQPKIWKTFLFVLRKRKHGKKTLVGNFIEVKKQKPHILPTTLNILYVFQKRIKRRRI